MNSKLQIISGKYKGRKLNLSPDARPTQNRARIALFNMLNEIISTDSYITVWDVFAGTGAFGFEILSRYNNANVFFTDISPKSIQTIHNNLALLAITQKVHVEKIDALSVLGKYAKTADVIFLDPPYSEATLGILFIKKYFKVAKSGSFVIWEQENSQSVVPEIPNVIVLKDKNYGRARFLILQKE